METPNNSYQLRTSRSFTPRLSERKKNLFGTSKLTSTQEDYLDGIKPLSNIQDEHSAADRNNGVALASSQCIQENAGKENVPVKNKGNEEGSAEQLHVLFSSSMCLNKPSNVQNIEMVKKSSDNTMHANAIESHNMTPYAIKRRCDRSTRSSGLSPQKKMVKIEAISIPTKSFYSGAKVSPKTKCDPSKSSPSDAAIVVSKTSPRTLRNIRRNMRQTINKGVHHKIRKRLRPSNNSSHSAHYNTRPVDVDMLLNNIRNEKLRNLIVSKRQEKLQIEKVHNLFRTNQNPIDMARPLTTLSHEDDTNNNNVPTAAELEKLLEFDFSDIEYDDDDDDDDEGTDGRTATENDSCMEEVIPIISHKYPDSIEMEQISPPRGTDNNNVTATTTTKKKFFKSGCATNTRKEVKITDHIKASVNNGRLQLLKEEKKPPKRPKIQPVTNAFSDEQATVCEILKKLDDTVFDQSIQQEASNSMRADKLQRNENVLHQEPYHYANNNNNCITLHEEPPKDVYSEFRKRLPYNTEDVEIIEQQHLLLDFLISNNICTEENFKIFIADPDNHKEEAESIINQIIVIVNEQTGTDTNTEEAVIPIATPAVDASPTTADATPTTVDATPTTIDTNTTLDDQEEYIAENLIDIDNSNNEEARKFFPVFYKDNYTVIKQQPQRRIHRIWTAGQGANQYQIDAGQINFGARQCKKCGLLYTMHEPEEEKLHNDYHASLHVLRFNGWIDEDVVAVYPEWAADGRIIRITETSHPKRRERLMDILKVVDKELGFASYVIPKIFVAYLAVCKHLIVGMCLVQPLEKAYKYINIDGIDCCSKEEFEAKCGISRIWVSPLHRRLHIASKLFQAVQLNTIFGEKIPVNKIAFSAPTDIGKQFAKRVTQNENFLVYQ